MHSVKYALFFDNHTQMENPDVGKNFDPEAFVDAVQSCGADLLTFHARCNVGFAYYNTKIGTRHPALNFDLFGKLAETCRERHLALLAYFNGGISTYEANQHRDWTTRYFPGTDSFGKNTPFAMTMCYNSPFREHLIGMIQEVARNYPVEGFFIDCLAAYPCVCPTCVRKMKARGMDCFKREDVEEFARLSMLDFCRDIAGAVREILPDPMLHFNGPVFGDAKDIDTFYDCECLPTVPGWGYEFLPVLAHSLRNTKEGAQILNMTARFGSWGDFGSLRPAASLEYDLLYGLANGMRPDVGSHFHPRGDLDTTVFARIREVYRFLQQFDPWFDQAVNLAEIAIVTPSDSHAFRAARTVRSAVRMLEELKMQFDIVFADGEKSWDSYRLLILPGEQEITPRLAERIRTHLARGGAFFCCGQDAAEHFGPELGIETRGDSTFDPVYFRLNGEYDANMDDMVLSLYVPACEAVLHGALSRSRIVKPYYNARWNGEFPIYYTPPQEETALPLLTTNRRRVWCAGNLFAAYAKKGTIHLRTLFGNIVNELLEKPLIIPDKLPASVRLTVTEQKEQKRCNVILLAYQTEKRLENNLVEDRLAVLNGSFRIRTGERKISSVTLAPGGQDVAYTTDGEYSSVTLPPFEGCAVVSFHWR